MSDMLTASSLMMRHLDGSQAEHSDAEFRRGYIRTLPRKWRTVLMAHALGRQPVSVLADGARIQQGLVRRNLLRFSRTHRPKFTYPTPGGREIIGAMLAEEAEKELDHLEQ